MKSEYSDQFDPYVYSNHHPGPQHLRAQAAHKTQKTQVCQKIAADNEGECIRYRPDND